MRKAMKYMTLLLATVVLFMNITVEASAASSAITFKGRGKILFAPGSGYTATDLFGGFKNLMPGDTVTENITVKNDASDCDYIVVYLQAVPHPNNDAGHQGQEMSPSVLANETVASMNDFLSELSITVKNGTAVIYTGTPDGTDGLTEPVLLVDKLVRGNAANLTVELKVPVTLGNEYANRVGEVDWKIKMEAYIYGGGEGSDTIIFDKEVPLADIPEGGLLDRLPQTGLLQWPILVMAAVGLLLVLFGILTDHKRKVKK